VSHTAGEVESRVLGIDLIFPKDEQLAHFAGYLVIWYKEARRVVRRHRRFY